MDNTPSIFVMNQRSHFMEPGTIVFIPPWIVLLIVILTIAIHPWSAKLFSLKSRQKATLISPYLLAFIIGSLMPAFDDLLTFVFGPPFAHHSVFHSLGGSVLTYVFFYVISTKKIAKYALIGNFVHTLFNFYFDRVTLFFPLTYQEFGLADIIRLNTYWLKAIHYPIIILLFFYAIIKYFLSYKKVDNSR